jgi:uncharacterized membrane protein (DUF373 family)
LNLAWLVIGAAIVLAIEGWLMAPLSPVLGGSILALAIAFLVILDLLKVAIGYLMKASVQTT